MGRRNFLENYRYVFDPDGVYGGDQNSPAKDPSRFGDIVRKYHPYFNETQVKDCLEKCSNEGCGYVAFANTVFLRFYGEPEKFEKIFGFPMFTPDGKINFDDLIVDFYCATDNHNRWHFSDRLDPHEDDNYEKGYGTTLESSEWRFEVYMKKHRVPVDVVTVKGNAGNIMSLLQKAPVVVAVRPEVLYYEDGKEAEKSSGGHAMTATGVTGDGMIRVSSWGKIRYIKPGTYPVHETYQQVIYKK